MAIKHLLVSVHECEIYQTNVCCDFVIGLNYALSIFRKDSKLAGLELVTKFPAFYGNRRFITTRTSARHLSLS